MAGFREFVTGEVLTAANVDDFLAKQAVMKFADAAARDTALGTAVASGNALREGMVAYLDDTDEVIKYDGTDWSSVAPAIAGIGSNFVQNTGTMGQTLNTGTFTDLTGVNVTLTPTSATAKVFVVAQIGGGIALEGTNRLQIVPTSGATSPELLQAYKSGATRVDVNHVVGYLMEPGTTSAVTFKVQATGGGTYYAYRWTMWAMEVAA